jgi:hypothetical protein
MLIKPALRASNVNDWSVFIVICGSANCVQDCSRVRGRRRAGRWGQLLLAR